MPENIIENATSVRFCLTRIMQNIILKALKAEKKYTTKKIAKVKF
jgi:hypothetical protein